MRRRHVLVLQLDGSLPNLALLRIAGFHRAQGDCVEYRVATGPQSVERGLYDTPYHRVYASLIFEKTRPLARRLVEVYPRAVLGGTGWDKTTTLETVGIPEDAAPDYSDHPNYPHSIGFTQRGCRLACSFCVVREKEGEVRPVGPVSAVWRGEPYPRNVVLLDNDFFGNPNWPELIAEMRAGHFRVSFNQGINVRLIGEKHAEAIASVDYFDPDFKRRRLYTAWDNREDENRLFRGLGHLKAAGVPPGNVTIYVLVAYDHATKTPRPTITADDVYRVEQLREWGADPYPMPFVRNRETIGFQRWVLRRAQKAGVSWEQFKRLGFDTRRGHDAGPSLFDEPEVV
jgi:hypothetical protein